VLGTPGAFTMGMNEMLPIAVEIRVTVVSIADGELFQVFECAAEDIGAKWFLGFLSDAAHPWRRFRVFVNVAGEGPSYV